MARMENDGLSIELKFFVGHNGSLFRTDVFLKLGIDGQPFPHSLQCRQAPSGDPEHYHLDPAEWWYGWDTSGYAYVDWLDQALKAGASLLNPDEPWHFGRIDLNPWTAHWPSADRSYSLMIGIDNYNIEILPDNGLDGGGGPALHMTVDGAQLEAFREEMLRDLRPQWDKFAEFEAWRE